MTIPDLNRIQWPEPWQLATPEEQEVLAQELRREVGRDHPLWQKHMVVIGRRVDDDDILVWVEDTDLPIAIVHLTWRGATEPDKAWPHTVFYASVSNAQLIDAADRSRV